MAMAVTVLSMETRWHVVRRGHGTNAFKFSVDHFGFFSVLIKSTCKTALKWHFAKGSKLIFGWGKGKLKQSLGLGEVRLHSFIISCTQACREDLCHGKQGTWIHPLKDAMKFWGRNRLWDRAVTFAPPSVCPQGGKAGEQPQLLHGSAPQGREADVLAPSWLSSELCQW